MLASLVGVLLAAALPSIRQFGLGFVVGSDWRPNEREVPKTGADGKVVLDSDGEAETEILPPTFGCCR